VRWIDEVLEVALSGLAEMKTVTPEEEGPGEEEKSESARKGGKKKGTGARTHH
jgi:hypothetical protein